MSVTNPADGEKLVYGTAWKGDQTAELVYQALESGFRALATAAQPKHYQEHLVGEGIRRAIGHGVVTREAIFIQTTFTPSPSQDPGNLPYDPTASLELQVETSLTNSLATLAAVPSSSSGPYLDALILHVPYLDPQHTRQAWRAMSHAVSDGRVRQLGISNTSLQDLEHLVRWCRSQNQTLPTIVQNRFYPGYEGDFDHAVRQYCGGHGITYQAFGLLRNKALVEDQVSVGLVARILGVSNPVALYALVMEALLSRASEAVGSSSNQQQQEHRRRQGDIRVLDGTTKEDRMREDVMDVKKAVAALRRARSNAPCGDGDDDELNRAMVSFRMGFGQETEWQ